MIVDAEKSIHWKIKKLSAKVKLAISQQLLDLEQIDNIAQIKFEKLKGQNNRYKIRIGNHRIVYKVITDVHIQITAIADRKSIYKRLFEISF